MYLVPKNFGNAYANKQSAYVYLYTVIVFYQAQSVIKSFSGFLLVGDFRVLQMFMDSR